MGCTNSKAGEPHASISVINIDGNDGKHIKGNHVNATSKHQDEVFFDPKTAPAGSPRRMSGSASNHGLVAEQPRPSSQASNKGASPAKAAE